MPDDLYRVVKKSKGWGGVGALFGFPEGPWECMIVRKMDKAKDEELDHLLSVRNSSETRMKIEETIGEPPDDSAAWATGKYEEEYDKELEKMHPWVVARINELVNDRKFNREKGYKVGRVSLDIDETVTLKELEDELGYIPLQPKDSRK